jgi:hypothetical protein
MSVIALPTAQHPVPPHVTELRKLRAVTFGLGWIDQAVPFHISMKLFGWKLEPPPPPNGPVDPTAQHWDALRHDTEARKLTVELGGTGLVTTDQTEPSQFSIRVASALPLLSVVDPDTQQSVLLTQVTSLR